MDQFEMYRQVVATFRTLLLGGLHATMLFSLLLIAVNTLCDLCGFGPFDLSKIRASGDMIMDRITVPLRTNAGPVEVLSERNKITNAVVIGAITVIVTTSFQLVTISLATGVSVASASLIGVTYSPTRASTYIVAFSMLLAVAIFTHANTRIQEGLRYA
ncbi:hypothetical protein A6E15_19245 [Natrinema saccharevitans]|uniref:Uncharacterized protein n=1 Tax=Natrinema saccharevitans TaxID=301967 RepID=A0A1S8ARF6_9EURY|nr:hypothetical protein [Natrinema saccharevitans]OLZ39101.1 hypothetical protein A6E15_19245 [Natrinema saccharevitans]